MTVLQTLPLDITIGLSSVLNIFPYCLSLNFHRLNDDQDTFLKRLNAYTFGAEFTISPTLLLRGGYSINKNKIYRRLRNRELPDFRSERDS